jgi:hypothetical protein
MRTNRRAPDWAENRGFVLDLVVVLVLVLVLVLGLLLPLLLLLETQRCSTE